MNLKKYVYCSSRKSKRIKRFRSNLGCMSSRHTSIYPEQLLTFFFFNFKRVLPGDVFEKDEKSTFIKITSNTFDEITTNNVLQNKYQKTF